MLLLFVELYVCISCYFLLEVVCDEVGGWGLLEYIFLYYNFLIFDVVLCDEFIILWIYNICW